MEAAAKAADLQALKEQDEELQEMEAMLVLANAATKLAEDNQAKMSQLEGSLSEKGVGPARLSVSRPTDVGLVISARKVEVPALMPLIEVRKMLAETAIKASTTALEAADLLILKDQDKELQEMEAMLACHQVC